MLLNCGVGCDRRAKCRRLRPAHRPTSKVRGRSREDPMPEGQRPRGSTLRPRSGGRQKGDTQCPRSGAVTRGFTWRPRSGAAAGRRQPTPLSPRPGVAGRRGGGPTPRPHAQGQGRWPEEQPQVQGALASRVQEGLEELSQAEGQKGWL